MNLVSERYSITPYEPKLGIHDYILKKISKFILYIIGWKSFEQTEQVKRILSNERYVLTFSHTSSWDAVFFLLYKFAHPETFSRFRIIVKPQVYDSVPKWTHSILNKIGFMKATAYENKNGGFVNTVVDTLKDKENFSLLISPKGKRENSPWRSGYFAIAKELNCDIMVCGLDYEKKRMIFFDPVSIKNKSREEIEPILMKQLSEIVPLYTECSEVSLRKHKKENITLFTISFIIICLLIFMTYLSWYYKLLFILVILIFFILL